MTLDGIRSASWRATVVRKRYRSRVRIIGLDLRI